MTKFIVISSLVSPSLRQVQRKHFPIKTIDLEKSSREAVNFEIVLETFIKIFSINLNWDSLQWLFLILRESDSPYWHKIKPSLNTYLQKIIHSSYDVFLSEISSIFKCFTDANVFYIKLLIQLD